MNGNSIFQARNTARRFPTYQGQSRNTKAALGTKNRQKQTADICKQRLREKYPDKLGLVEEFIAEIEGPPQNCDLTCWGLFTDIKGIKKEMFQRLEIQFEKWLNP